MAQAYFKFNPIDDDLSRYYVLHSGVSESYNRSLKLLDNNFLRSGVVFYVFGPKGSGKSHFINVIKERLLNIDFKYNFFSFNIDQNGVIYNDDNYIIENKDLIDRYQEIKSNGGLLIFEANEHPSLICKDPHLTSRFKAGEIFEIKYPMEEELRPVLKSLLERHHLRLKDSQIEQILSRIPAIPEYFELISATLNELISVEGKLKKSKIKDVLVTTL